MFNSLIDEILWDDLLPYKFIRFANSKIQTPQNEQVEILQPQKFKRKKIYIIILSLYNAIFRGANSLLYLN